jgi:hypothetical protein
MIIIKNPPVEGTVNSLEQKTPFFCQTDVQEFHLKTLKKEIKGDFLH